MGRGLSDLQKIILKVGHENKGRLTYWWFERSRDDSNIGINGYSRRWLKGRNFYLNEIYKRYGWNMELLSKSRNEKKLNSIGAHISRAVSRLVARGLVEKVRFSDHHDYVLTEKGNLLGSSTSMTIPDIKVTK
jgi:hypothetical protein